MDQGFVDYYEKISGGNNVKFWFYDGMCMTAFRNDVYFRKKFRLLTDETFPEVGYEFLKTDTRNDLVKCKLGFFKLYFICLPSITSVV